MKSKKAEEYIKENSFDSLEDDLNIACDDAIKAVEIAEREMRGNVKKVFAKLCALKHIDKCSTYKISHKCDNECSLIREFLEQLNK